MKTDVERMLQDKVRAEALKDLSKIICDYMFGIGVFNSCVNCAEWSDENEICNKFKQRPPAKVIVSGCSHHTDIPF